MGNMINIDFTVLIQLANFLVTIVVLNFLLIKPVREQIKARTALTDGYTSQVEQFTAEAAEKLTGYENALSVARTEATVAREALKSEGKAQEQTLVAAAQSDAQAFIQDARTRTAKEAKAATDALLAQVNVFASKAITKILG